MALFPKNHKDCKKTQIVSYNIRDKEAERETKRQEEMETVLRFCTDCRTTLPPPDMGLKMRTHFL